jgi:hypothetical protein
MNNVVLQFVRQQRFLIIAVVVFLAGGYVMHSLEKLSLELEYDIVKHSFSISYTTVDIIEEISDLVFQISIAICLTLYLRKKTPGWKWSVVFLFFLISIFAIFTHFDLGKNPYTYYENLLYIDALSYLGLITSVLAASLLLMLDPEVVAKIVGVFLFILVCCFWYNCLHNIWSLLTKGFPA